MMASQTYTVVNRKFQPYILHNCFKKLCGTQLNSNNLPDKKSARTGLLCSRVARCSAPLSPSPFPPSPSHSRVTLDFRLSDSAQVPSVPILLLPSPSQRSVELDWSPSAKHCAPWPVISFCQRERPWSRKFSLSVSPSRWALASVKPLVPSSRVTSVLFLQRAGELKEK